MKDKQAILDELQQADTEEKIQEFHATYLGKKGQISGMFKTLKDLPDEEKKQRGKEIKELFDQVEQAFFKQQATVLQAHRDSKLKQDIIDYSTPGMQPDEGYLHLLSKMRRRVEQIFQGMGFSLSYGDHLVDQYNNFTSLNIPASHPAREMHDTLYVKEKDATGEPLLLRTHTTAMDNQLIKELGTPCKFVIPGRVYRYENLDASHDCAFWQVEGTIVDKGLSISHFKSIMKTILEALLEKKVKMRLRPAYFPFVEPGFEIDAWHKVGNEHKRLEILGAGMLHPYVLKEADVDPKKRSGIAFGLGMTRLVAIKHNISDVRLLTHGDVRFTQSF